MPATVDETLDSEQTKQATCVNGEQKRKQELKRGLATAKTEGKEVTCKEFHNK